MSDKDYLNKAYQDGWRSPEEISKLEIEAYNTGMITERNRVLFLFKGIKEEKPMRAMDIWSYINKILDP